jgi:hypothetical protein
VGSDGEWAWLGVVMRHEADGCLRLAATAGGRREDASQGGHISSLPCSHEGRKEGCKDARRVEMVSSVCCAGLVGGCRHDAHRPGCVLRT